MTDDSEVRLGGGGAGRWIGVDGFNIARPHGTGIATYGTTLVDTLRSMGHPVAGVFGLDVGRRIAGRETLFHDRLSRPSPRRASEAVEWIGDAVRPVVPIRLRDVPMTDTVVPSRTGQKLPRFDRLVSAAGLFRRAQRHFRLTGRFTTVHMADPPAAMHWTCPIPIRMAGTRNLYTIHDLVPLRLPHATRDRKDEFRSLLDRCIRTGDHIVTVSDASRRDILALFPDTDPDHVTNCYQISAMRPPEASRAVDAAIVDGMFGLPDRGYFLFYGAIEPKKNVVRLIEAYLGSGIGTPLVIVGRRNDGMGDAHDLGDGIDARRLPQRIMPIDHLPQRHLARLIRGARALVFPSLYEGFGLPVLEAMQLGTPVLSSTAGSIPEIAGDAALLIDPYDVAAIIGGLRRLDEDAGLRSELSTAGARQAATFSQDRYRDRLADLYQRILV